MKLKTLKGLVIKWTNPCELPFAEGNYKVYNTSHTHKNPILRIKVKELVRFFGAVNKNEQPLQFKITITLKTNEDYEEVAEFSVGCVYSHITDFVEEQCAEMLDFMKTNHKGRTFKEFEFCTEIVGTSGIS